MRVLMTTDTVGGVWTFTKELACGLLQQGCSVALVSLGRLPDGEQVRWAEGMKQQWGDALMYRATEIPLEWMQANDFAYSKAEQLLFDLAEQFQADVLHSNQFCFGSLPLKIPKLVTAHSDVLSWANACNGQPLERSEWLQRYCQLVADGLCGADAVVAPTQWMMGALESNFNLPLQREVIPNGRAIPPASGSVRKLQAVSVGRLWDRAKGTEILGAVHSRIPLLLAGEATYERHEAARDFGTVRLLGLLSEREILELFRESAVYLCTSRYEPFGLAPLEAALCGCAVVANDLPSLREVWGDGAVYFNDAATLGHVLASFYADPGLLQRAQARSLARAKIYTREAMTTSYHALFKSMLHGDGALSDVA